ncbi:MAG: DUF1343 domain-containing protein [Bacteroidales bacterium]|nr:DUF1343 domain-containing protein [Bacteroidales bacterium]
MKISGLFITWLVVHLTACGNPGPGVVTGDMQPSEYMKFLKGKRVAVVANQASVAGEKHVVDELLGQGVNIILIFAPEHGFRDLADAGQKITDGKDPVTGLPVVSLYGKSVKPSDEQLKGIDAVVYDIQDVGARFYTYISTMHYVMESCAGNNLMFVVLDRPNPNGFYVDGNIPDIAHRSFVCMHPVPVVHGMTTGEYAMMINGEGWLEGGRRCDLRVVKCKNYTHKTHYELPVKPSPNLPNQAAVWLYPSLCFFEGTVISCGRGTDFPFQAFGHPLLPDKGFSFTPQSMPGAANPPLLGQKCFGTDLRDAVKEGMVPKPYLNLEWLLQAYRDFPEKEKFFNGYFDVLAGGPQLREQILKEMSAAEIRASWKEGLEKFSRIRRKYLLYD